MPTYNYRCKKCNAYVEVSTFFSDRDKPRKHSCGGRLVRVMSLPLPAIIKTTGKGMALDALNSGKALPDRWYKNKYEQGAAFGLERPPKTIW